MKAKGHCAEKVRFCMRTHVSIHLYIHAFSFSFELILSVCSAGNAHNILGVHCMLTDTMNFIFVTIWASVEIVGWLFDHHRFTKHSLSFHSNQPAILRKRSLFFLQCWVCYREDSEGAPNAHCPLTRKLVTSPFTMWVAALGFVSDYTTVCMQS